MANCRACGGVLGRDCFNEADCLEISRNQYGDIDNNIDLLNDYISILIYKMEQNGISIPNSFAAEPPLIFKPIYGCETEEDYSLPF